MIKCTECGHAMESRRENHRYVESGLFNVVIVDLEVRHCGECGHREYVFPRLAQLHSLLAANISEQAAALTGEQIRFLRKHLGWSRDEFAAIMGVAPETISRWETAKATMGASAERLLRILVSRMKPVQEYPSEKLADVGKPGKPPTFKIFATPKGWAPSDALA